tara:strand:- start:27 stop:431 length:405 start_codon:yes stop_codon:yes gene_type:complete
MSTLKVNAIQDASGANESTTAEIEQGRAKLWISFNGTGTVSIRDSFNVSSITDNGTGQYTINFATAMANTSYCAGGAIKEKTDGSQTSVIFMLGKGTNDTDAYTTTKLRASSAAYVNDQMYDSSRINAFIFGDQ